jgi:hypothetical protein
MATVPILPPRMPFNPAKPPRSRQTCRHCGSGEIVRQRARGIIERHLMQSLHFFPFWCVTCDRRSYLRIASDHVDRL